MLLLGGCTRESAAPRPSYTDEFSIAGALEELPATLDGQTPLYNVASLREAGEAAGQVPIGSEDNSGFIQLVHQTSGGGTDVYAEYPLFLQAVIEQGPKEEFGVSWTGVTTVAEAIANTTVFTIVTGVSVPVDLETVAPGVTTLGTGEDLSSGERSALSRLGYPLRIGDRADAVALSTLTPPVREWMGGGHTISAADDDSLLAVADHLDSYDAWSASLLRVGNTALGYGWAADDDGLVGIVVVSYASNDEAEQNLDTVRDAFVTAPVGDPASFDELGELESIIVIDSEIVATARFFDNRLAGNLEKVPSILFNGICSNAVELIDICASN